MIDVLITILLVALVGMSIWYSLRVYFYYQYIKSNKPITEPDKTYENIVNWHRKILVHSWNSFEYWLELEILRSMDSQKSYKLPQERKELYFHEQCSLQHVLNHVKRFRKENNLGTKEEFQKDETNGK